MSAQSLCVECGPDVGVDEDGLCASCGATAMGAWLDCNWLALQAAQSRAAVLEARVKVLEEALWLYIEVRAAILAPEKEGES